MSLRRRRRALLLFCAAAVCGLLSLLIAARLEKKATAGYGPLQPVVVVSGRLTSGQALTRSDASERLTVRRIPSVFVPPTALRRTESAIGKRPVADLTPGTYLQLDLLDSTQQTQQPFAKTLGRRPVEVTVAGAGALVLGADDGSGVQVDVVVSGQPGLGRGSTEVVARGVPLIRLARPASPGEGWKATVAVSRGQALALIAAESSGRVIRLLPLRVSPG